MKIVCPKCQAAYEIDLPESPTKDISAKCTVCNSKFPIKKGAPSKPSPARKTMSGPPLAQIDSESDAEAEDDFLSGLQEDFAELHPDYANKSFAGEKNLDDYLDQLLQEESQESSHKTIDKSIEPPEEEPSNFEMPSEEELDHLFDSIITEEIKTEDAQEQSTTPRSFTETDLEEDHLDALFDEIINDIDSGDLGKGAEDSDETEAVLSDPDLLIKENEEMDPNFSDLFNDENPETEAEESDHTIPSIHPAKVTNQEGPQEDAVSEEKELNQVPQEENAGVASDAGTPEPSDPESAVIEPEDQKSEDKVQAETVTAQEEEKSDDDLWAEAFADQEAVSQTSGEEDAQETSGGETPETAGKQETAQEPEEEKSDDDLWAEAFADQEAVRQTSEEEDAQETSGGETPETAGKEEAISDLEEDAEESSEPEAESDPDEEPVDEDVIPELESDGEDDDKEVVEAEAEDPYGDYEDDEKEYSPPPKKKSGIFTLPSTRTGKLVLGGGVLALLLTGGGVYFALQTLAPPELMQMGKNESEVNDALKPKQVEETSVPQQKVTGSETATIDQQQEPAPASTPGESTGETSDITKELGKTNNPLEVAKNADVSEGLLAGLVPSNHGVELTAIMPVAYNVNDIRVLSFSLEAEMSDADSAKVVREALPVFEKITITTVEQLLDKKFFNDILYVQEKLKKNLQTNFNKTLEGGGRVKKINFKEFTIQ